jgi:hypothetical protein
LTRHRQGGDQVEEVRPFDGEPSHTMKQQGLVREPVRVKRQYGKGDTSRHGVDLQGNFRQWR